MAVAMQAQLPRCAHLLVAVGDGRHQLRGNLFVLHINGLGHDAEIEDFLHRPCAIAPGANRDTLAERRQRPDGMHAPHRAPEQLAMPRQVQVRRAAGAAFEQREAVAVAGMQRLALKAHRRRHRQFGRRQLGDEGMFLADLRIAPATLPVELGHQLGMALPGLVQADAVDAILVAVQRQQAPVGDKPQALHRRKHRIRREAGIIARQLRRYRRWARQYWLQGAPAISAATRYSSCWHAASPWWCWTTSARVSGNRCPGRRWSKGMWAMRGWWVRCSPNTASALSSISRRTPSCPNRWRTRSSTMATTPARRAPCSPPAPRMA